MTHVKRWRVAYQSQLWEHPPMLIGKHVRLAEYEASFAPFITEWMNDPEYWGPFYNIWTSTQPQWEEELAKSGDDSRTSALKVDHDGTCFAREEYACAGVPRIVGHDDAGVELAVRGPREVKGGGPQDAKAFEPRGEVADKTEASGVGVLRIRTGERVLVDRYQRVSR